MVYQSDEHAHNYLTTRDLDLVETTANNIIEEEEQDGVIFKQDFIQTAAIKE